jgi:hypothetical protein
MKRTERDAERLRREIGQRKSRRGPLSHDLRERGTQYARGRAADGAAPAMIASELGLAEKTIERWLGGRPTASMLPVRVVDVVDVDMRPPAGLVVTTSRGIKIEGLDFDALCELVTRCG